MFSSRKFLQADYELKFVIQAKSCHIDYMKGVLARPHLSEQGSVVFIQVALGSASYQPTSLSRSKMSAA